MHHLLALAASAILLTAAAPLQSFDAYAFRSEDPATFAQERTRLGDLQAKRRLTSPSDADRLARMIIAEASMDERDYAVRRAALENKLAKARRYIAIMKAGGPYPKEWQENMWLKARAAAISPEAIALFERVFLDQSVISMQTDLDAPGKAAFRAALAAEQEEIIRANTAWLKSLLQDIGWFDISRYGAEASQAAWLMVQHADHDPEWQKEMLADLEPRVKRGDMQGSYYAYLVDRVAVNSGQPQTYGTQGVCVAPGERQPKAVIAPEALDERRAEVGLEPIATYRARFTEHCN